MNKYKGCIFDLDGTLLNTIPTIMHYSNLSLKKFGFNEISMDKYRYLCRLSYKEYYKKLLLFGGCPNEDINKYLLDIGAYDQEIYLNDVIYLTEPFCGIIPLLKTLKSKGIKLAVLTNKPHQIAETLTTKYFESLFDLCVGYTPETISKPDPRSLLNLLEKLSLNRDDCIYVGDSDVDVKTAKNADVFSVAVDWGYQEIGVLQKLNPECIINTANDLLSFF